MRPLETFRVTRAVALQWVAVSSVGFFAFAYLFADVLARIRGESLEPIVLPISSQPATLGWLVVFVVLVALVIALHETIHGLLMAHCGGEPTYGVGVSYFIVPYAYTNSSGGYTRNQMLAILLAPFVVISVLGVLTMAVYPSPILVVVLAANAAGSIGDLWMAAVLVQFPPAVWVGPMPDRSPDGQGMGIYGSSETVSRRTPGSKFLSAFFAGTVATFVAVAAGIVGAVLFSLAVGTGTVLIGDSAGRWFLFRHDVVPASEIVILEVGGRLLVSISLLGGLCWSIIVGARRLLSD
ncbi:hypothetical protein JCM18750_09370 [Halostagnicola bangensis]